MKISSEKKLIFFYFTTKHRLWVHVRTASFWIKKNKQKYVYSCIHQFYNANVGFKGVYIAWTCLPDVLANQLFCVTDVSDATLEPENPYISHRSANVLCMNSFPARINVCRFARLAKNTLKFPLDVTQRNLSGLVVIRLALTDCLFWC